MKAYLIVNLIFVILFISPTINKNASIKIGEFSEAKSISWDILKEENSTNRVVFSEEKINEIPSNRLGALLWSATHEAGNQNEWIGDGGGGEYNSGTGNSAVSTTVARTGKYSLKLSINTTNGDSHGTRNYRWKEIGNNLDLIFTQYFYFPSKIDLDPMNDWFNLIQTKGVKYAAGGPGTGPDQINNPHYVVGLDVRGGAGSGGANYLTLADLQKFWSGTANVVWKAPQGLDLPIKKWVKIQMRIIQDKGNNGRILLWQDDVLVIDTGLRNTLRPEVDVSHFSINAYADKTFPNLTSLYLDDLSINLPDETTTQIYKVTTAPFPVTGGEVLIGQFSRDTKVEILSPLNNSSITKNSSIMISANALSNISEVQKIEYYEGALLLGTSLNYPHEFNWSNVAEGIYSIKIKAYFKNGDTKYSYVNRIIVK